MGSTDTDRLDIRSQNCGQNLSKIAIVLIMVMFFVWGCDHYFGFGGLTTELLLSVMLVASIAFTAISFLIFRRIGIHLNQARDAETDIRVAAAAFKTDKGMIIMDSDGIALRVNQAFTQITGYEHKEIVGSRPPLFCESSHEPGFGAAIWGSLKKNRSWKGEVTSRRKSGEIFDQSLSLTAVDDEGGQLTYLVGEIENISGRKAAEDEIRRLAFYDSLTNLPNRRLLMDRLSHASNTSVRSNSFGALMFIDLDNFKILNDTLGHDKGDQLLKHVAEQITHSVRNHDSVARFGGDEFVVVLERLGINVNEAADEARVIGERILSEIRKPFLIGDHMHHSSGSIGVTLFRGVDQSVDDLMKQADLAMYRAKGDGRNIMRFFDQEMQLLVNARATIESDMRDGIERSEFMLYYQPQVSSSGEIIGVEALLRWNHPVRGFVPTGDFIALAEETGLIMPLGEWVIRAACSQLAIWSSMVEFRDLCLSINVSALQFRHQNFVGLIRDALTESGANPQNLKIEITESMLVDDIDQVVEKMESLKEIGVGFSLDDFGTGYSSLAYLKRLPLDQLKIDQSFIRDVLSDPNDASIARTIIALAKSLGLAVIAEGVETEGQREFLCNEGCPAYQGYLFSRPDTIEQFEAFFAAQHNHRAI